MTPETCDICDAVVMDQDEIMEDDGIFRCGLCHEKYLTLRRQYPEQF